MKKFIWWRGWHCSPLFVVSKYTFWFTNGISFGVKYNPASIVYYLGWLIMCKDRKNDSCFIEKVNAGTWPKGWLWIVKYGK